MGSKQRGIWLSNIPKALHWTKLCNSKIHHSTVAESNPQNAMFRHLDDVSVGILAQKAGNIELINIPDWVMTWKWINDNPKMYNKYHVIHTGQERIDKVEPLWKNIYNNTNNCHQYK